MHHLSFTFHCLLIVIHHQSLIVFLKCIYGPSQQPSNSKVLVIIIFLETLKILNHTHTSVLPSTSIPSLFTTSEIFNDCTTTACPNYHQLQHILCQDDLVLNSHCGIDFFDHSRPVAVDLRPSSSGTGKSEIWVQEVYWGVLSGTVSVRSESTGMDKKRSQNAIQLQQSPQLTLQGTLGPGQRIRFSLTKVMRPSVICLKLSAIG